MLTAFQPLHSRKQVTAVWSRGFESEVWQRELPDGTTVRHKEECHNFDLSPLLLCPDLVWEITHPDGSKEHVRLPIAMRCHTPDDLQAVVQADGYEVVSSWGGYSGERHGDGSQLVLLAH